MWVGCRAYRPIATQNFTWLYNIEMYYKLIHCRGDTSGTLLWPMWEVQCISYGTSGTKLGGFI